MSDVVLVALVGAVSAALGAVGQYVNGRRASIENLEVRHAANRQAELTVLLAAMQTELTRMTSDRDRLMAIVLRQVEAFEEAAKAVTTKDAP
jgi:hypothetical protein